MKMMSEVQATPEPDKQFEHIEQLLEAGLRFFNQGSRGCVKLQMHIDAFYNAQSDQEKGKALRLAQKHLADIARIFSKETAKSQAMRDLTKELGKEIMLLYGEVENSVTLYRPIKVSGVIQRLHTQTKEVVSPRVLFHKKSVEDFLHGAVFRYRDTWLVSLDDVSKWKLKSLGSEERLLALRARIEEQAPALAEAATIKVLSRLFDSFETVPPLDILCLYLGMLLETPETSENKDLQALLDSLRPFLATYRQKGLSAI